MRETKRHLTKFRMLAAMPAFLMQRKRVKFLSKQLSEFQMGCSVVVNELYSDQLYKTYHLSKEQYQTPTKRLSDEKRKLVSIGLPVRFVSRDKKINGVIDVNERGDLILTYFCLRGQVYEKGTSMYLIDASDETIKQCRRVNLLELIIEYLFKRLNRAISITIHSIQKS